MTREDSAEVTYRHLPPDSHLGRLALAYALVAATWLTYYATSQAVLAGAFGRLTMIVLRALVLAPALAVVVWLIILEVSSIAS